MKVPLADSQAGITALHAAFDEHRESPHASLGGCWVLRALAPLAPAALFETLLGELERMTSGSAAERSSSASGPSHPPAAALLAAVQYEAV